MIRRPDKTVKWPFTARQALREALNGTEDADHVTTGSVRRCRRRAAGWPARRIGRLPLANPEAHDELRRLSRLLDGLPARSARRNVPCSTASRGSRCGPGCELGHGTAHAGRWRPEC
jgi:hypothetical protein